MTLFFCQYNKKFHSFGPMGLRELTTPKFVVIDSGKIHQ